MIMTRETDYAVRILRALKDGDQLTAGQLAEGEYIPMPFTYKILKKLAQAGYVEIFRGAEGGCRLSADLDKISLFELIKCINEDIFINACGDPGYECPWRQNHCGGCRFHKNLELLQKQFHDLLKEHSVGEMI